MTSDELLDTVLALGVQVLELMHGRELLHVQPVRGDYVCRVAGEKEREGEQERERERENRRQRGRDNKRREVEKEQEMRGRDNKREER